MSDLTKALSNLCPLGYNAFKEYKPHKLAKSFISTMLHLDVNCHDIRVSRTWLERREKGFATTWELPDISFKQELDDHSNFKDIQRINIEIQPNFLFVDTLANSPQIDRFFCDSTLFIFLDFDDEVFDNISTSRFSNIFVLDDMAKYQSRIQNTLVLNCYYKIPYIANHGRGFTWVNKLCRLDQLKQIGNEYLINNEQYINKTYNHMYDFYS